MTEKQMYRRLNEAFESDYKMYESEAEWYGDDDPHIWRFEIPSLEVRVRMTLEEENKRVVFEEEKFSEQGYKKVGNYSW